MVRVPVARDEPERERVVGCPLDLAAGEGARGVAVDEQRQQRGRVVRVAAPARVGALEFGQVQRIDHVHHAARQVALGQPILHRRRQQVLRVAVSRLKCHIHLHPGLLNMATIIASTARRNQSPTGS